MLTKWWTRKKLWQVFKSKREGEKNGSVYTGILISVWARNTMCR